MGTRDAIVANDAHVLDAAFRRLERMVFKQRTLLEECMGLNDDVTAALADAKTKFGKYKQDVSDLKANLNAVIDDLRTQLNSGPPGLTAEQGQAALQSLIDLSTDVQAADDSLSGAATTGGTPTDVNVVGDTPSK